MVMGRALAEWVCDGSRSWWSLVALMMTMMENVQPRRTWWGVTVWHTVGQFAYIMGIEEVRIAPRTSLHFFP